MADSQGEVEALATSLDLLKIQAENARSAHKHAENKRVYDGALASRESYDPDVAHFLAEEILEPLTEDVRAAAGRLNILARMARDDATRGMGLYLFDQSLLDD